DAHQVEGADQVDPDDRLEVLERRRGAVAVDGPLGPADAGAVDDHAQRGAGVDGGLYGGGDLLLVGDVGLDEHPAHFVGQGLALVLVQVGDDHLRALSGQLADGGLAETARTAGDDGGNSVQIHKGHLT